MLRKKRGSLCMLLTLLALPLITLAQRPTIPKFGKVTLEDFKPTSQLIDSGTSAVILFDVATSDFEGNNDGDFSLIYKRRKRVLIIKRSAFDLATVSISTYVGNTTVNSEKLADVSAATYYIEGGTVVERKLGKDAILTEKATSSQSLRKFTFPEVKEGCIIDYEYTIRSPRYQWLKSWVFQNEHPVLWSEYTVTILPLFTYVINEFGYIPYTVDEANQKFKHYSLRTPGNAMQQGESFEIRGDATVRTWGIKDVPAFRNERFISTPANHISRIEFQLRSIRYSAESVTHLIKDWRQTAEELMQDADFAKQLYEDNSWLNDELKKATKGVEAFDKAKSIYDYVRDNFSCIDHDALWLSQPLKKTLQTRKGNVVDINMLLTAMLIKAGLSASPVMLSTRDNGVADNSIALLSQYNYVIVRVYFGDENLLLDASRKLSFGQLDPGCYNGEGRVIEKTPLVQQLQPDSIGNEGMVSVNIVNAGGGKMEGMRINWQGVYESMDFRDKYWNKNNDEILKDITTTYPKGFSFSDLAVDSLKNYDYPVNTKFKLKFDIADNDEDVIYFTPFLESGYTKNPFVSVDRKYPVEMPYRMNDTYLLTMEIPEGYEVDEMPKSTRVHFNETEGMYEFIASKQGNKVMIRSKINFKKATFPPDDYETLRNFFGFIVKKQSEVIVFKKK